MAFYPMHLSANSLWIGLLVLVLLLLIIAIRFIWPFNYLFLSKNRVVRQITKKLLFLFIAGFFSGWGILAGTMSLNMERTIGLVVLALMGISCGTFVWAKIPQWFNLKKTYSGEKLETVLDQIDLFYDFKYKQKKWLEDENYTKLGQSLQKDDQSRKFIMGLVSGLLFIMGLVMIYDIYVIGRDLPLQILPGIKSILLGPMIFAFDRSLVREEKKIGHFLIKKTAD